MTFIVLIAAFWIPLFILIKVGFTWWLATILSLLSSAAYLAYLILTFNKTLAKEQKKEARRAGMIW